MAVHILGNAVHILGNGPSIELFDRDAWPETDVFVGCNFSDPSFRVDYTSVVDVGAMKRILKGHQPSGSLLLSTRAAKYGDEKDSNWKERVPSIEAIVDLRKDRSISRNLSMNSAQHAAVYSIGAYPDHTEIHLWGIDSFWSSDIRSTTDALVRPNQRNGRDRPKITRQWHGYWHQIFSENSKTRTFVIHKPINKRMNDRLINHSNVRIAKSTCHTQTTTI